jgi:repressor LexA
MQGLTKRQAQTLDYIRQSIEERGYPPTLREIGEFMGIRSTNGVNDHLRALERKGYLRREDMKSRALRLVGEGVEDDSDAAVDNARPGSVNPQGSANQLTAAQLASGFASNSGASNDDSLIEVPVVGRVAAGLPILAEDNLVDTLRVDRSMLRGGIGRGIFGLRVQGDSMIEAGILSGDYIFVRQQPTAERGQIVVALIGEEATVKYFYPERDYVRFQPANATMAPILVRAMDFKPTMLLGVVVGLFRRWQ